MAVVFMLDQANAGGWLAKREDPAGARVHRASQSLAVPRLKVHDFEFTSLSEAV